MHEGEVALDGLPRELFADRSLLEKVNLEEPALSRIVRELREAGSMVPAQIASATEFVDSVRAAGMSMVNG
jgi:hypothetical protein